jgi:hypothetical protein
LDTVVRGVYIEVAPGPAGGETLDRFVGQEDPPLLVEREVGGLEIILEGKQRYGVDSGSPVTYRGLRVGRIVSVRLSSDSSVVEARAYIEPAFRGLVRENSVFWSTSGIDVKVGVTGVRLDYDTLATIAAGGVSMATPPAGGEPVSTGKRFDLEPKVKDGWLEYTPRIPVGSALLPPGVSAPQALRVSLHWRTGSIVRRNRDRLGWALPLTGNRLLGLAEVLHPDPEAEKATAGFELEIDGKRLPLDPQKSKALASLAVLALADALPTEQSVWPDDRIRRPSEPEECLIAPGQTDLAPLTVAQLQAGDGVWRIDPSIALNDDWHGAPVVSASDGAVIGFVTVSDDGAQVELAPQLQ